MIGLKCFSDCEQLKPTVFLKKSPVTWQHSFGPAGLEPPKSERWSLRGKDTSQDQVINAELWETIFWFLRVGCLVDLRLYWGCRVVKESKSRRVLGFEPFLSLAFQFLRVWINPSAWVDTSWSLTYWQDSSMERVPAFKKVLKLFSPSIWYLSPDLWVSSGGQCHTRCFYHSSLATPWRNLVTSGSRF